MKQEVPVEDSEKVALVREVPMPDADVIYSRAFRKSRPPILTAAELSSAENLTPGRLGPSVRRISETKVVKFGRLVDLCEAEALDLLYHKAPSVPVPRVYNAYRIGKITYIVMDYIPGRSISRCWQTLSDDQKSSVVSQLREHVTTWRRITGQFFGTVNHGPCEDSIFFHSFSTDRILYGPFRSRQEFNQGVVLALRNSRPNPSQYNLALEPKIMERQGDEMIFTHGDLGPGNILVNDESKVTIIDWGSAGYSIKEREFVEAKWQASQD